MISTELYLCRHGQTDWNAEGRLQGQEDIPLNALGRQQARRNGQCLRNLLGAGAPGFDFVSSPLGRAVETMRIIRAELDLAPDGFETDPRLVELHFGDWQGSTLDEVRATDPEGPKTRKADKWNFVPPGARAESYALLAERVRPVFEALSRPTIMTAHGGVSRCVLRMYGGFDDRAAARGDIAQDRVLHWLDGGLTWV